MERFISYFKQLSLRRFIPAIILSLALFMITACSPSNAQGARPYNPPVQMGGNNNPHSMGGDGYTNSKVTTDPKITNQRSAVDLQQSIASSAVEPNSGKILYPGSQAVKEGQWNAPTYSSQAGQQQIPAMKQRVIDRSNPDENIMEGIGQQFEQASEFLKNDLDSFVDKSLPGKNPIQGSDSLRGR